MIQIEQKRLFHFPLMENLFSVKGKIIFFGGKVLFLQKYSKQPLTD